MKMSLQWAMLLVMCCMGLPHVAQGADSTLVLVMGGEAYDGPPKFEVDFAGKVLGEGTVAAAIDTAEARRRKGHAGRCATFMVRHMRALAKEPVWQSAEDNPASWKLAAKLGFVVVDEMDMLLPR